MRLLLLAIAGFVVFGLAVAGLVWLSPLLSRSTPTETEAGNYHPVPTLHPSRTSPIRAAALSGDGFWLTTAGKDNLAHLWDLRQGKEVRHFKGHAAAIRAIAISRDGSRLATGGEDAVIRLWDGATEKVSAVFQGPEKAGLKALALSGDGNWLAAADGGRQIRVWDLAGGKPRVFSCPARAVQALAISDDGRWLVSGGDDVELWDLQGARKVRSFKGHSKRIGSVALSADGQWLAAGSDDESVRVWEAASGDVRRNFFETHPRFVAISADGQWIAAISGEKFIMLCPIAAKEARHFESAGGIRHVSLSRDGKWLFVCGEEETHVWNAAEGRPVCRLISFRTGNWAVIDMAGRYDASGDGDMDDLYWTIDNQNFPLKHLKDRFYDPGLLAKHLGFNSEPLRTVGE